MLHTRVIVKAWSKGSAYVQRTEDRGARFRDQDHIEEITAAMKAEIGRGLRDPQFRVETREAG